MENLVVKKNKDVYHLERDIDKKRKIIEEAYNTMKAFYKEVSKDEVSMRRLEDRIK